MFIIMTAYNYFTSGYIRFFENVPIANCNVKLHLAVESAGVDIPIYRTITE